MAIKYANIFHFKPSKIYPNLAFWFVNKPSGNPVDKNLESRLRLYVPTHLLVHI
jgi:hypothetical protein